MASMSSPLTSPPVDIQPVHIDLKRGQRVIIKYTAEFSPRKGELTFSQPAIRISKSSKPPKKSRKTTANGSYASGKPQTGADLPKKRTSRTAREKKPVRVKKLKKKKRESNASVTSQSLNTASPKIVDDNIPGDINSLSVVNPEQIPQPKQGNSESLATIADSTNNESDSKGEDPLPVEYMSAKKVNDIFHHYIYPKTDKKCQVCDTLALEVAQFVHSKIKTDTTLRQEVISRSTGDKDLFIAKVLFKEGTFRLDASRWESFLYRPESSTTKILESLDAKNNYMMAIVVISDKGKALFSTIAIGNKQSLRIVQ